MTNGNRVLVVGDYYVDMVFAGLPRWPQPGEETFASRIDVLPGGAFIHACALHRMGIPTTWAAQLGDDTYSRLVLDAAATEGLDTSAYTVHEHPIRNVSVAASHAGERSFLSFKEPQPGPEATGAVSRYRPAVVLVTELLRGERLTGLVAAARAVGARVAMDPQHVESTVRDPAVRSVLTSIDVFLPNASEARALTGRARLSEAVDDLAELTPTVVVKNGADGAVAARGTVRCRSAPPAVAAVDTVGAGDCFDAGFVAGLVHDLDLDACLRLGTLCGSLSTLRPGGQGAPHVADIARREPGLVPWAPAGGVTSSIGPARTRCDRRRD